MEAAGLGDGLWAFVIVGGFIILGLALAYAKLRNRTSPEQLRRTEEATRRMHEEQNRRDVNNG